jgi:prepilin signal peptidase PulO-like enzyme (type II secretory pathway)
MAIDATTRPSDATTRSSSRSFPIRAGLILLTCFGGIVAGSAIHRESDEEIAEALEEERPLARRVAIAELLYLSPAIVLGVGSLLLLKIPAVGEGWLNVLAWSPVAGHVPVTGLATAVSGMIVAGGVGWGVRIFFTLILGKEAFGLGDVHIMAAAGAVAGWVVVVVGFFLGAVFALAGVLCLLAVKRSRAIPFGPWLSIGIVLAIVAYQPIYDWFAPGLKGLMFMLNAGEPG